MKSLVVTGVCCFLLLNSVGLANDGFYQGAGATLQPVANPSMRVLSEKLDITPLPKARCYPVFIPQSYYDKNKHLSDQATTVIGGEAPCHMDDLGSQLITRWHAKAVYRVEALSDQSAVQIGFPVPLWNYSSSDEGGLIELPTPGVMDFKTSIDGQAITGLALKQVPLESADAESASSGAPSPQKSGKPEKISTTAFVWKSDFKKGRTYELVTEYDFGVDYSVGMGEGSDYPKGQTLWFDQRSKADSEYGTGTHFASERVIYYLRPIRLWRGGAPESISVRVEAPSGMPVYYLTPMTKGVSCVDRRALYFKWIKNYPEQDLSVAYPVSLLSEKRAEFDYRPIQKDFEYLAWLTLVASQEPGPLSTVYYPKLPKSCDLAEELKRDLGKDSLYQTWLNNGTETCVKSCD
jgi:hypothetical protein